MNRKPTTNSAASDLRFDDASMLSAPWSDFVRKELKPFERIIAWLETDLDQQQNFRSGMILLTTTRLMRLDASSETKIESIEFTRDCVASARVHAGLGRFTLSNPNRVLLIQLFTATQAVGADRLVAAVNSAIRSRSDGASNSIESPIRSCPSCGVVLAEDQLVCSDCMPSAVPNPSRSLLRLMPFARRRITTTILGVFLTVCATASSLVAPYLTMPLIDDVLVPWQSGTPISFSLVYTYLAGLAIAAFVTWILSWAKTYVLALASEQVSADLRNATYTHLQRLSLEFYGGRRTGDLIARISNDTERICYFLSVHLVDFISDIFMFVLTSVVLISIDPMLALATLLPFPLVAWLVQYVRTRLRHGFARASNAWSDMVSVLTDAIPGVRVVKAFAQERREIDRFQRANQSVLDANIRVNRLWSFFGPTVTLLTELGILVIWAFGVWRVSTGDITVGVLTAFLAYISRFYLRLDSMSRMIANTQRAAASTFRVFEILDRKPTVAESLNPIRPGRLKGALSFRNLTFKYGNREVLRGIDLDIRPGEMVGVVGPSGSGKSTLVNLVCRFYDITQGSICADGTDIRSFPIEEYRSNIGIVLQEPYLFYGTIAENISYGRPNATRAEIIEAARAAYAHHFIMRLPDGYDSVVGERGQSLSGGERQRISIARAILTDPRILILDEATSAVDNETEREIQVALDNLVRGRTTIAIAHRLSTLRKADRIVVLEAGRVVEEGKHEELLAAGGLFTRLYNAQRQEDAEVVGLDH